ncbi:MAG: response regulator [Pseudomonadota bacterium]
MTKKALVVDNDFFFVEFLTELLENRGYEVIKAYDGKDGILELHRGTVDLLFVDLIMPKIDGNKLIKFARWKFPDAPFPIIAVSGVIVEQLDEIDKIGADYYIAKGPIEKMADHVNKLMDGIENPLR